MIDIFIDNINISINIDQGFTGSAIGRSIDRFKNYINNCILKNDIEEKKYYILGIVRQGFYFDGDGNKPMPHAMGIVSISYKLIILTINGNIYVYCGEKNYMENDNVPSNSGICAYIVNSNSKNIYGNIKLL